MKVKRKSKAKQIIFATRKQMAKAVSDCIDAGLEVMLQRVPVDEGDLKSTIEKTDDGAGKGSLSAGGQSKISDKFVEHERHVEYGTSFSEAQPYFRPGLDAARRTIKAG